MRSVGVLWSPGWGATVDLFTIGHGSLEVGQFLAALQRQRITRVVDVRSIPHSRYVPWSGYRRLASELGRVGIAYEFAGRELGGKPSDANLRTVSGSPDYDRIAASPAYLRGIERVIEAAEGDRLALLCSESNPMMCHRERLIGRTLRARGCRVRHILADGSLADAVPDWLFK